MKNQDLKIYITERLSFLNKHILNFIVSLYFNKKDTLGNNLDYFLMYEIEKKSENLIIITHSQENVDENIKSFRDEYYINTTDYSINIENNIKIYSVLEGNILTFMLAEEY